MSVARAPAAPVVVLSGVGSRAALNDPPQPSHHDASASTNTSVEPEPDRIRLMPAPAWAQPVTDAADRLDRARARTGGRSSRAGSGCRRRSRSSGSRSVVPGVLERVEPREHHARAAHERLQQRDSFCDSAISTSPRLAAPGRRVEAQRAGLEHGRRLGRSRAGRAPAAAQAARRRRTAYKGSRPRRRRGRATRSSTASRAVSISTGVHTLVRAQRAAHLEAVDAREHHVEDDASYSVEPGHADGVLAAAGDVGG